MTLNRLLVSFARTKCKGSKVGLFRRGPNNTPTGLLAIMDRVKCQASFVKGIKGSVRNTFLGEALRGRKVTISRLVRSSGCFAALTFMRVSRGNRQGFSFTEGPNTSARLQGRRLSPALLGGNGVFRFKSLSLASRPTGDTALRTIRVTGSTKTLVSCSPGCHTSL